jgi:hypothetical protein
VNHEPHLAFAQAERLVHTVLVRRTRIGYVPDVWTKLTATRENLAAAA